MAWDTETGIYMVSKSLSNNADTGESSNAPDLWLSRPGGDYYIGISFHFAPLNFPKGEDIWGFH